jgi:hypothetical protein
VDLYRPRIVVAGDRDNSPHLTIAGPDWHTDPYALSPSPKSLVTLFGGEHGLGGISGYDVAETTDDNPVRVAAVQLLTCAYLRTALHPGDSAWQEAQRAVTGVANPLGRSSPNRAELVRRGPSARDAAADCSLVSVVVAPETVESGDRSRSITLSRCRGVPMLSRRAATVALPVKASY